MSEDSLQWIEENYVICHDREDPLLVGPDAWEIIERLQHECLQSLGMTAFVYGVNPEPLDKEVDDERGSVGES